MYSTRICTVCIILLTHSVHIGKTQCHCLKEKYCLIEEAIRSVLLLMYCTSRPILLEAVHNVLMHLCGTSASKREQRKVALASRRHKAAVVVGREEVRLRLIIIFHYIGYYHGLQPFSYISSRQRYCYVILLLHPGSVQYTA